MQETENRVQEQLINWCRIAEVLTKEFGFKRTASNIVSVAEGGQYDKY